MLRRIWDRLTAIWRQPACESCGAPAVGFVSSLVGRIPTHDAAGKPVTKMYLRGASWRCRACMGDTR